MIFLRLLALALRPGWRCACTCLGTVPISRLKYFVGGCILVGGLLFKLGAPLMAIAAGMLLAWVATQLLNKRAGQSRR